MVIKLCRAEQYDGIIREFRQEICRKIGTDPNGSTTAPLHHAIYVFGCESEQHRPAGMVEFFFYHHAFRCYAESPYNQAFDLAQIAPMSEMVHVRSVIIDEQHRNSRLFLHLCAAFINVAYDFGARYMTASTSTNYDYILGLHRNAGMVRLGTFTIDGSPQQLSVLELEPVAQRAKSLRRRQGLVIEGNFPPQAHHSYAEVGKHAPEVNFASALQGAVSVL